MITSQNNRGGDTVHFTYRVQPDHRVLSRTGSTQDHTPASQPSYHATLCWESVYRIGHTLMMYINDVFIMFIIFIIFIVCLKYVYSMFIM